MTWVKNIFRHFWKNIGFGDLKPKKLLNIDVLKAWDYARTLFQSEKLQISCTKSDTGTKKYKYVCILCMNYMYLLHVIHTCMYCMYLLHVCIACIYYMYVLHVCIACMYCMYVLHVCITCMYDM